MKYKCLSMIITFTYIVGKGLTTTLHLKFLQNVRVFTKFIGSWFLNEAWTRLSQYYIVLTIFTVRQASTMRSDFSCYQTWDYKTGFKSCDPNIGTVSMDSTAGLHDVSIYIVKTVPRFWHWKPGSNPLLVNPYPDWSMSIWQSDGKTSLQCRGKGDQSAEG